MGTKTVQNCGGRSNLAEPLINMTSLHRSQKMQIPMRINNLCPGVESGVGIVGPKNCPILPGVRNRKMLIPMGFWQFCVGGEAYSARGWWISGSFVWEGAYFAKGWNQEDANPKGFLSVLSGGGVIFCQKVEAGRR